MENLQLLVRSIFSRVNTKRETNTKTTKATLSNIVFHINQYLHILSNGQILKGITHLILY